MSYIEFRNIGLTFQTKTQKIPIFDDLNLKIERGSFTVIYGASGKGKSTMLNLISGFIVPNQGAVIVDNRDISHMSEKEKCRFRNRQIGYMFQNFNLIQQLNVMDNIATPLYIKGESKKESVPKVNTIIKSVNLENRINEYPNTLSGGEQQRAAFARAVINNPGILLADEPIANLDRDNGDVLIELLESLWKKGVTVICVSHDERMRKAEYDLLNIENLSLAK